LRKRRGWPPCALNRTQRAGAHVALTSLMACASANTSADAKAGGSAKGTAKQQAGVELGGGLSMGAH